MKPSLIGYYLGLGQIPFIISGGKSIFTIFFWNVFCPDPVSSLTGIQFGDNGGQVYVTEENGVAMATIEVSLFFEIIG